MRISGETKLFAGIILVTVAIMGIGVFLFSRPAPILPREVLLPEDVVTRGAPDAKTYLVEFSDFQCPSCRLFKDEVDRLTAKYKDKLFYGYRHFPLSQHPFAYKAALAAESANDWGKFWEIADYFFSHQDNLSDQMIEEAGQKLGLDGEKFKESLKSEKYKNKIERDIADGRKFGIDATPTFFLNGRRLTLFSVADLEKTVEKELNK